MVSPAETVKAKSHWKPQFSLLLFGLLLSKLGTSIYMLSLLWLAYDLTGSSLILGSVFAVEMLPYILLMPFGGVLIDKMSRKKIMIVSDVLRCIVLLSVPVLFGVGLLEVGYIYLLSFSMSVLSFMVEVSLMAIVPTMAPFDHLTRANSHIQMIENISTLAGPLLAAFLLGAYGTYMTLALNAFAFLVMAFCVLFINVQENKQQVHIQSLIRDAKEGLRYLGGSQTLRMIAWVSILCNLGMGIVLSTLVFYMRNILQVGEHHTSFTAR